MKVKLTVDVFSGRPNPTLTLEGTAAKKVMDDLQSAEAFKANSDSTTPEPGQLGYRGILIEPLDAAAATDMPALIRVTPDRLYAGDSSAATDDNRFEKHVFDQLANLRNVGNKKLFRAFLNEQVDVFRAGRAANAGSPLITISPAILKQLATSCGCAPPHELAWWNVPAIQPLNNCYNYATNYRSNTFAQPGLASGLKYTSLAGCAVAAGQRSAKDGAVADCLIDLPAANNQCPGNGHLVALVVAPGIDYHWYRKGPDGKWSHKPGQTAATLVDNAGNPITDPRTANRGPYTQFCTFMQVIHGHVKIK